jgi:hypothetical protein
MDLEFTGNVWEWRGPSPFYFVTVPVEESAQIEAASAMVTYGWGMIPVEASVGSSNWSTKNGGYVVPLKSVIRAAEGIVVGDVLTVRLRVSI